MIWGGHPGEWEGEHPVTVAEEVGADGIYFAGWRGHDDLPEGLAACDALVVPSVDDPYPQVPLEAMAVGLPCSRAAAAACSRWSTSTPTDPTGWFVPPDDPDALSGRRAGHRRERPGRDRGAGRERASRTRWPSCRGTGWSRASRRSTPTGSTATADEPQASSSRFEPTQVQVQRFRSKWFSGGLFRRRTLARARGGGRRGPGRSNGSGRPRSSVTGGVRNSAPRSSSGPVRGVAVGYRDREPVAEDVGIDGRGEGHVRLCRAWGRCTSNRTEPQRSSRTSSSRRRGRPAWPTTSR